MKEVQILDCTLRDGGYYTDWDFNRELVDEYYKAMEALPIDYVEIGYRSKPLSGYLGKYFYCPDYVMKDAKEKMPSKKLAVILNEKDVRAEDAVGLLSACIPYLDLIRIAVAPENIERAILLANAVKAMGFEVAFNVMYMSKWLDAPEFMAKIKDVNGVVDYLYLVDSYGGATPNAVQELMDELSYVDKTVLGFHGHNNMEMALINTLTAMEAGAGILDCTITGMGRGAGNLKTELLLTYFAKQGKQVSFTQLSRVVDLFEKLNEKYGWGPSLPYMFSGANSLPQKEVMEWVGLNRYPISTIVNALSNKKNLVSDNVQLPKFEPAKKYKKALIIGGGPSVTEHQTAIEHLIKNGDENDICVIHAGVRYLDKFYELGHDQYYCMVGSEKDKLERRFEDLSELKFPCIFAPYPRKMGTFLPEGIEDYAKELRQINFVKGFDDSLLAMAIQAAIDLGADKAYLVGYDGYEGQISKAQFRIARENQSIIDAATNGDAIDLVSCSNTNYENIEKSSIYSINQSA